MPLYPMLKEICKTIAKRISTGEALLATALVIKD